MPPTSNTRTREIKKNRPDLVILCLDLDNPVAFQALSMLKLDPDTAPIPLLTCTTDDELERPRPEPEDEGPGLEFPASPLALRLN